MRGKRSRQGYIDAPGLQAANTRREQVRKSETAALPKQVVQGGSRGDSGTCRYAQQPRALQLADMQTAAVHHQLLAQLQ
jgi:hypothetical protein